ncbi:MAG: glycosyltransferase family 10 [Bacteroidales bacterium]
MDEIKINFCDFWNGFNKEENLFINLLRQKYSVSISEKPDLIFYSVFSKNFYKYKCIRIFYTGENLRPNFNECDFAISFDYINDKRHLRYPLYLLYGSPKSLIKQKDPDEILKQKTKFCCFMVSNAKAKERIDFFHKLSEYKKVDSAGKYLNNIDYYLPFENETKLKFIKDYKFVIAFENSSFPGYTTEKIYEPMLMSCLPIYWGNPLISKEFNSKSFINLMDFKNFDQAIEHIIKIDSDDSLYKEYLSEPYFCNNVMPEELKEENLIKFLDSIIAEKEKIKPVAKNWQKAYYYSMQTRRKLGILKRKN